MSGFTKTTSYKRTVNSLEGRRLQDYEEENMASHEELRELMLICYADNMLSDEEFLVLYENYESKNPDFPCDSYDPFKLENMDEAECKAEFRVEKNDLHGLVPGT